MTALQAALPAPYYVDDAHWRREREQVLHSSWFCAGRLSSHGLAGGPRSDWPWSTSRARACWSPATPTAALRAFYNVCRHRGSQVVPVDPAADAPAPCAAASLRCPYHSWTYDLEGRLLRAPHTEDVDDFDPAAFGLHPVAVDSWAGFLFLHLTPALAAPLADVLGEVAGPARPLPARRRWSSAAGSPTTSRPTTRSCWRTTTSATTAPACTPS